MFQDTQPAALGADGASDPWAEFRVEHPGEVLALMRRLRDGEHAVNLNAPGGHMLHTTLWALDESHRRLNFALHGEPPELPALIESEEIIAVAYLDSVKLQFDLGGPVVVRSARSSALQAALPEVVYRFQRRQAFRVRPLVSSAPTARLRHPAMPDMTLELRVLDVSIGGCALFVPHDVPPLQPGTTLASVQVSLDLDTGFETTLQMQHVTAIQPDQRGVRMGCAWVRLPPAAERALQRYIDQTQKRRRLLSLG
jgi:flagellar brake protein